MPDNLNKRNILICAALTLASGLAGWFGFQYANESIVEVQQLLAAVFILVWLWRYVKSRTSGWLVLAAWHLGASISINHPGYTLIPGGILHALLWAGFISLGVFLLPRKLIPAGLLAGSLIAAITPWGILNPILAAFSFFPAWGWVGLATATLLLALPAISEEKIFLPLVILACVIGTFLNATQTAAPLPVDVWAMQTETIESDSTGWQADVVSQIIEGIDSGARVVLTSGAPFDASNFSSTSPLRKVKIAAKSRKSKVLVTAYMPLMGEQIQSGVLLLPDNRFYPDSSTELIAFPNGKAAFLVDSDELLLWPAAIKLAHKKPEYLISLSGDANSESTSIAKKRSAQIQARLWGVPLLRAVNYRHTQS